MQLKLRQQHPLEYFKAVRFSLEYPERVTGHLIYLRVQYSGYNYIQGDAIDEAILKACQSFSAKAAFIFHTKLLTTQQYEQALHITRGGVIKNIILYFLPDYEIGKLVELVADNRNRLEGISLKMTFWTTEPEKIAGVPEALLCDIPEDASRLLWTIKATE